MVNSVSNLNTKTNYVPSVTANNSTKPKKNRYNPLLYSSAIYVPAAIGGVVGFSKYDKEKKKLVSQKKEMSNYLINKKAFDLREKLLANFSDLVVRLKEGRLTEMPNCLLITGNDPKYCDRVIDWVGKTSGAKYLKVNHDDNLVGILEKSEENYQNTKSWNLIHVNNMDKLIDHSQVKDRVVEGMKDIMSAASEDYHSTMIFRTTHPEDLDTIALQPHRVKKFDLKDVKEADFFQIDEYGDELAKVDKQLSKLSKNKKVLTGVAIGAGIGVILATAVSCGKKLFNIDKNDKK